MIIRKNYGCTHFIIGRDMAGCKSSLDGNDFYGAYDAQDFALANAGQVGVTPVPSLNLVFTEEEVSDPYPYPYLFSCICIAHYCVLHTVVDLILILILIHYSLLIFYLTQGYVTAEYAKEKGLSIKNLSGTKFRQMLRGGDDIPTWFAFESVVKVLREEAQAAPQ